MNPVTHLNLLFQKNYEDNIFKIANLDYAITLKISFVLLPIDRLCYFHPHLNSEIKSSTFHRKVKLLSSAKLLKHFIWATLKFVSMVLP